MKNLNEQIDWNQEIENNQTQLDKSLNIQNDQGKGKHF